MVVGDRTTTGGVIITGVDSFFGDGRPVARMGDKATSPKCNSVGTLIQGLSTFNVSGKGVALDGYIIACGCPAKNNRIIASLSMIFADDTQHSAPAARSSPVMASSFAPPALHQSIAPQSAQSLVDNTTTIEPVFAKSCLRGSGCTNAGTTPEPTDNFGGMAFYQAATFGAVNGLMREVIKGHLHEHIVHEGEEKKREEDLDVVLKVLDSYIK